MVSRSEKVAQAKRTREDKILESLRHPSPNAHPNIPALSKTMHAIGVFEEPAVQPTKPVSKPAAPRQLVKPQGPTNAKTPVVKPVRRPPAEKAVLGTPVAIPTLRGRAEEPAGKPDARRDAGVEVDLSAERAEPSGMGLSFEEGGAREPVKDEVPMGTFKAPTGPHVKVFNDFNLQYVENNFTDKDPNAKEKMREAAGKSGELLDFSLSHLAKNGAQDVDLQAICALAEDFDVGHAEYLKNVRELLIKNAKERLKVNIGTEAANSLLQFAKGLKVPKLKIQRGVKGAWSEFKEDFRTLPQLSLLKQRKLPRFAHFLKRKEIPNHLYLDELTANDKPLYDDHKALLLLPSIIRNARHAAQVDEKGESRNEKEAGQNLTSIEEALTDTIKLHTRAATLSSKDEHGEDKGRETVTPGLGRFLFSKGKSLVLKGRRFLAQRQLYNAIRKSDLAKLKKALSKGASATTPLARKGVHALPPVHIAVKFGRVKGLEELLKQDDVDLSQKDLNGFAPAYYLTYHIRPEDRTRIANLLAQHRTFDPMANVSAEESLLHLMATSKYRSGIPDAILNHPKADVNALNNRGETPLYVALLSAFQSDEYAAARQLAAHPDLDLDANPYENFVDNLFHTGESRGHREKVNRAIESLNPSTLSEDAVKENLIYYGVSEERAEEAAPRFGKILKKLRYAFSPEQALTLLKRKAAKEVKELDFDTY